MNGMVSLVVESTGEALDEDWDELADSVGASPFLYPGWVRSWWRAFGRGTLLVLTARRGQQLQGLIPVYRRGGVLRSTSSTVTPYPFGFLGKGRAIDTLSSGLLTQDARRVSLCYILEGDPGLESFDVAAHAAGYSLARFTAARSPYLVIDRDWADYERQVSKSLRSEIHRNRRRLQERGVVQLEVADGRERLDELLEEGLRVEAAGWKSQRRSAILSRKDTHQFFSSIGTWAAQKGWLRLAFLRLDGHPLAFDFSLEHNGVHYLVKTGYDDEYRAFGPGKILRYDMLRRAFTADLRRYEFLGSDEAWKLRWTTTCRDNVAIDAFAPSLYGITEHLWSRYSRKADRFARNRAGPFVKGLRARRSRGRG